MDKRYQIFVSSTYDDLRDERDQVIKAILEMGHIPVGMEMFSAADEEQWQTIKREIDRSDYYLVIIAHRYGSTIREEGGISYTEKEYDYASSTNVPRIGFVISRDALWKAEFTDEGQKKRRLETFKAKVKGKPVDFWTDARELATKVAISVPKLIATTQRPGWQRSTEDSGRTLAAMTRLTEENANLREELERLRALAGERVPLLDCQFVSEKGQPLGRELLVSPPDNAAVEELRRQRIGDMEALVDDLDALSRGEPDSPSVRPLDWLAPQDPLRSRGRSR